MSEDKPDWVKKAEKMGGVKLCFSKKELDKKKGEWFICKRMTYEGVVATANTLLQRYGTMTIRQLFYQFVSLGMLSNRNRTYDSIRRYLEKARLNKLVDWRKIRDDTRYVRGGDFGYDLPEEWLKEKYADSTTNKYRREAWYGQERYVEVWVEKDALFSFVEEIAGRYDVAVLVSRGAVSMTHLLQSLENRFPKDKECWILHLADHDPSGIDMTRDLRARIREYTVAELTKTPVLVKRVALNYDQVRRYNLLVRPNPVKMTDTKAPKYVKKYGKICWELDALPPDTLQNIIEEEIKKLIDWKVWNENEEREKKEQEKVDGYIEKIDGWFSDTFSEELKED